MTQILDMAASLADRFYHEGISLEEQGALEEAMRAFERAVRADQKHVAARIALAYHYRRLERVEHAIDHCRQAVASAAVPEAYFALGHMLIATQQYDEAMSALRRCLELDPHYDQALYQIAFVYYLQGEYDVAITEFHRAAHHEPDWETLFFLGECYRMTRRTSEAEHILRRALSLTSSWGQVEITRGQLLACQRMAEFPADTQLSVKDRVYAECGVIYLGARMDDGLEIPPYLFYKYDYEDLAWTMRRLLALKAARGWEWSAVMPVDIISLPLALALAMHLGIGTEPLAEGQTLVVQALGETVEGLQDGADRLADARTFCLLACWPEEWRPDIVGLVTPLIGSLPWYRTRAMQHLHAMVFAEESLPVPHEAIWQDQREPEVIAADILAALDTLPPDPTLPRQIAYYEAHPNLRWC